MRPLSPLHRAAYWLPAIGYAGLLSYLVVRGARILPPLFPGAPFLGETACNVGLGFLIHRGFACTSGFITRHTILLAILLTAMYGVGEEALVGSPAFAQADSWFFCAKIIGAALGAVAYLVVNNWLLERMGKMGRGQRNIRA